MAYTKGIYGDGAEGKKKKTAKTTTKSQPAVTTPKPAKPATVNVPAQSTNTARQEQRREQQYRAAKKPSAAAVPAQNTDDARQEQLQEQFYRQNQEQEQRIQRAKDLMAETARTEQLAARAQTRQETKPQGMESLAAAKQQAEKAWNDWLWDKGYNPNSPKGLEDFYRKAGISLPGTTKFDGRIPTVQQLYEAVQRGKAEELSAEAARREQQARRARELEAFYEQMDRETGNSIYAYELIG